MRTCPIAESNGRTDCPPESEQSSHVRVGEDEKGKMIFFRLLSLGESNQAGRGNAK